MIRAFQPLNVCLLWIFLVDSAKSFTFGLNKALPIDNSLIKFSTQMQMSATQDQDASAPTNADQDAEKLLEQILQVAVDASKKAGDIILGNAGGAEVTKSKANSRDLLTLIDPLCEKVR